MKAVIIVGSSREDGDTAKLTHTLVELTGWDIINLLDLQISHYDYKHRNRDDDFIPLMHKVTTNYDLLIMATPVYWYAMSGVMKTFFDRVTDLLTIEKDLGRKLRGKKMAVISSSNGGNLGQDFWLPFEASAKYLGMEFRGGLHTINGEDNREKIEGFVKKVSCGSIIL